MSPYIQSLLAGGVLGIFLTLFIEGVIYIYRTDKGRKNNG